VHEQRQQEVGGVERRLRTWRRDHNSARASTSALPCGKCALLRRVATQHAALGVRAQRAWARASRKAARTVGERRLRRGRSGSSSGDTTGVFSGTRGFGRCDSTSSGRAGGSAIATTAARRLATGRLADARSALPPAGAPARRRPLYAPML